jgi:hypothetical protein
MGCFPSCNFWFHSNRKECYRIERAKGRTCCVLAEDRDGVVDRRLAVTPG